LSIKVSEFGKTDDNQSVKLFTVKNNNGIIATFTNWGATIVSLMVPDKTGKAIDVVLGFDKLEDYFINHCYFGATIGRNGNRIGNASFKINKETLWTQHLKQKKAYLIIEFAE